jgi:hypothetical protein
VNTTPADSDGVLFSTPSNQVFRSWLKLKQLMLGNQAQADWTQSDNAQPSFIKNKPSIFGGITGTRSSILALPSITSGANYIITDPTQTTNGAIDGSVQLTGQPNNLLSTSGTAEFFNADFQGVGDYSGVQDITGFVVGNKLGIWGSTLTPVSGDIVVCQDNGGKWFNYQNITGSNGSSPDTDTTNWIKLLTSNTNQGYLKVAYSVEYDITADQLRSYTQPDANGTVNYMEGSACISWMRGYNQAYDNKCFGGFNGFVVKKPNFKCQHNTWEGGCYFEINEGNGDLRKNYFSYGVYWTNNGSNSGYSGEAVRNFVGVQAYLADNTAKIKENIIGAYSDIEVNAEIRGCEFGANSYAYSNGYIHFSKIGLDSGINNNGSVVSTVLDTNCALSGNISVTGAVLCAGSTAQNLANVTSFTFNPDSFMDGNSQTYSVDNGELASGVGVYLVANHSTQSLYSGSSTFSYSLDAQANYTPNTGNEGGVVQGIGNGDYAGVVVFTTEVKGLLTVSGETLAFTNGEPLTFDNGATALLSTYDSVAHTLSITELSKLVITGGSPATTVTGGTSGAVATLVSINGGMISNFTYSPMSHPYVIYNAPRIKNTFLPITINSANQYDFVANALTPIQITGRTTRSGSDEIDVFYGVADFNKILNTNKLA